MNMIKKYLNPQNDVAFKRIFGHPKNKDILMAMLNEVLKNQLIKPIQHVEFLATIQEPETAAKKQFIVDVLCEDQDKRQYIIEMQVTSTAGFQERAQYYAYKAFIQQADKGGKYKNLKEVIFLAFCNFSIFPNKKKYKSEHITLDKATYEHDLDKLSFTFVDLVKFDKQNRKALHALSLEEKFYYFLRHADDISNEDLAKFIGKDKVISRALDELAGVNWTNEELLLYEREDKRVRDNEAALDAAKEKGMKEGREKGIKDREREIINQMLAKGMSTKLIEEITGLSV